jgi:methylglutaconyl-CoA hydratase
VAVEGSRFAFSEVKLGLIPGTIAPYVIEAVGARKARQLFLSANIFDADYAAHVGLIDMVLPDGSVEEFISMLTDSLTANAPGAMGEAKRLVHDLAGRHLDHGLMEDTARRIARARVSAEGQEGVRAFLDKRPPRWAE